MIEDVNLNLNLSNIFVPGRDEICNLKYSIVKNMPEENEKN